jgi:hypothetical protein
MLTRLVLNLKSSCLSLPSAKIIGVYHHTPPELDLKFELDAKDLVPNQYMTPPSISNHSGGKS